MASTPFDIPAPGSSYAFDIYHDNTHALRAAGPALPGGPCNYTDQTLPRCGCRRFWSRASLTSGVFQDTNSLAELCMCSHHACFHEDVAPAHGQAQQQLATGAAPGQENQRPKTNREPLSPVQLPSFQVPGSLGSSLDFNLLDFQASMSAPRMPNSTSRAEGARPGQDSPMPDTFDNWGDLARLQGEHATGLPPFPAQCLMSPPPPPSTSASSQATYLRPFAGKGLQTLSGAAALRPDSRRQERSVLDGGAEAQNPGHAPTEAAPTPKAHPTQDCSEAGTEDACLKLADRVDSHEQRLDRIEANSFSVAGHDDCHDRHEHIDLRVAELESRVDEVEKLLNDNGSVVSSRRTVKQQDGGGADDATASVVSVSTNATVLPANRAEVYSQLQQLQAQVTQLQATALPTYAKPWELEVVFLPFPLKGIWMDSKEFANQRRSIGSNPEGGWTQLPNTISRATPDPQSPKFQEWAGQGPESNWLLPRAFAAGRVIDQRLRSRGLIKTVMVRGADARSVQLAVHGAFEDVLRVSANSDARLGFAPDYPLAEFLGLRQAWVPLRKLHKDSRLRFLSPAELATPALWDFTFLVSSVVMKATGVQRLYITQPEAYLQDHPLGCHALEAGWTWQKLRLLSRVYPDSQSSADVPEADAMEECWNWNDRLDEPPSVAASAVSLRQSIHQRMASRRSSTEPSGQFYTGVQSPILSVGPSRSRAQSPLIQRERKASWPPHIRTGSLPPVGPGMLSPAQSRRRISSHAAASATPYERRSSPFVPRASPRPSPRLGSSTHNIATANPAAVPKRRFTRSPSLVPRNTPRWSRTSMSRSPSLAPGGLYGYHEEREREQQNRRQRTTTPFYYATPHSEAIPEHGYNHRAGSRGPSAAPSGMLLRTEGYFPGGEDDGDEDMGDGGFTSGSGSGMDTDLDDDEEDDDSEMADHHPNHHHHHSRPHRSSSIRHHRQPHPNSSFGFNDTDGGDEADLDLDIDVYEDEDGEDELDGVDIDHHTTDNDPTVWHGFARPRPRHQRAHHHQRTFSRTSQAHKQHQQQLLRPEDIPWAGIEDTTAAGAGAAAVAALASAGMGTGGGGGVDDEGDSNMSDGENIDPTSASSSFQSRSSFSQIHGDGHGQGDGEGEIEIHEDDDEDAAQRLPQQSGMGMNVLNSNGSNNDNNDDDETSSQAPSEYSSKPGPWQIIPVAVREYETDVDGMGTIKASKTSKNGGGGGCSAVMDVFRIHEDGTAGAGGVGAGAGNGMGGEELLDTQWA